MKKILITITMLFMCMAVSAQVYWDELDAADGFGYFLASNGEGVFDTVRLETRGDSLCIVDNDCIMYLPEGILQYGHQYDPDNKRFQITLTRGGSTSTSVYPFEVRRNTVSNYLDAGIELEMDQEDNPMLPGNYTSEIIPINHKFYKKVVNDSTIRFMVYRTTDQLYFGDPSPLAHDSFDIVIPKAVHSVDGIRDSIDMLIDTLGNYATVQSVIDSASQIRADFPTGFSGVYNDLDFTGTTGLSDGVDDDTNIDASGIRDSLNLLIDTLDNYATVQSVIDSAIQIRADFPTGFSGVYNDLDFTGTTGLSDGVDDDTNIDASGIRDSLEYVYQKKDQTGDPDSIIGNEFQNLSLSGTTLNISDGVGVSLASFQDGNGYWTPYSGGLQYSYDENKSLQFGRAHIGYVGYSDLVAFSHVDHASGTGYSILQTSAGKTLINSATGQNIDFKIGNSVKMTLLSDGKLGIGTNSPDELLEVNGSIKVDEITIGGTTNGSITIGNDAGVVTQGIAIGYEALQSNQGQASVAIGYRSLKANQGIDNFGIGTLSLYANTTGFRNVGIGTNSLVDNIVGNNNIGIGFKTLQYVNSNNNVGIGANSGSSSAGGGVFIGHQSGQSETGSNKLYIDNSGTSSPLVYGEFDTNLIKVNGKLGYTNNGSTATTLQGNDGTYLSDINLGAGLTLAGGTLSATGSSPWTTSGSNIYRNTGNIGIGTASPSAKLDIVGDTEVNGELYVSDQIGGNAINAAGYSSAGQLVRLSMGNNISISSGTLNVENDLSLYSNNQSGFLDADDISDLEGQDFASANVNNGTITGTSYTNLSLGTIRINSDYVSASTILERFDISRDGYYRVYVTGTVETTGSDDFIELFAKEGGTYNLIGILTPIDSDEIGFSINKSFLFSDGDNIVISAKQPTTGQGTITIKNIVCDVERI